MNGSAALKRANISGKDYLNFKNTKKYFSNKVNDKCIYDQKIMNKLFFL